MEEIKITISHETMEELGHQICMGIRHGFFGAEAKDNDDIGFALDQIGGQISDAITEGLHNGTINVRIKNEI